MSFPLLVITSPEDFAGEQELLLSMFDKGLSTLHVRKPRADEAALERWLLGIPHQYHSRLVVHRFASVAQSMGALGFHGEPGHAPFCKGAGLHGYACQRSCSLHSLAELRQLSATWDYAFLSPIFDSISKLGYRSAFSSSEAKEELRQALTQQCVPIYALGGVDADTLPEAHRMGFAGAVLMGALWNHPDSLGVWEQCRDLSLGLDHYSHVY